MAQDTLEKKIDGRTVRVTILPPRRSTKLLLKISPSLLPAFVRMATAFKKGETLGDSEIDSDGLMKAVIHLLSEMPPERFEELSNDLLEMTWVDGKEVVPNFDVIFRGELLLMAKVIAYSFEVNYASFLPASVRSKLKQMIQKFVASGSQGT